METIDIVIIVILGLGAIEGFRKGFLMSVLGLVGFIVAIILAFYFMDFMADWLAENVDSLNIGYPIFAFFLIFVGTMLVINGVGWMLKKTIDMVLLGSLDKAAGLMLGVVKVAFFLSLFFYLTNMFDLDLPKDWTRKSETMPYIEPVVPFVVDLMEPSLPVIEETLQKMEDLVEKVGKDLKK